MDDDPALDIGPASADSGVPTRIGASPSDHTSSSGSRGADPPRSYKRRRTSEQAADQDDARPRGSPRRSPARAEQDRGATGRPEAAAAPRSRPGAVDRAPSRMTETMADVARELEDVVGGPLGDLAKCAAADLNPGLKEEATIQIAFRVERDGKMGTSCSVIGDVVLESSHSELGK